MKLDLKNLELKKETHMKHVENYKNELKTKTMELL